MRLHQRWVGLNYTMVVLRYCIFSASSGDFMFGYGSPTITTHLRGVSNNDTHSHTLYTPMHSHAYTHTHADTHTHRGSNTHGCFHKLMLCYLPRSSEKLIPSLILPLTTHIKIAPVVVAPPTEGWLLLQAYEIQPHLIWYICIYTNLYTSGIIS